MTDKELVCGIRQNDRKAIEELVNRHRDRVIKTAFYFLQDMEEAEDLSQEIFLEILRSAGRFRQEASLGTWIYRITVNRSLNHLKKINRKSMFRRMEKDHEQASEHLHLEEKERRRILNQAVQSLSENQRIAFVLSKYEELPYKQISEVMNISLSSVESLIFRAKENLQKKLVRYFSEYAEKKK